jgi:glycosyltransferase involved in cell wall biosynthesis
MKTIRIFAMPSHTFVDRVSGVDYVRIIQPMKYLNGYKDNEVEFQVTVYDHSKNKSFDWREVFEKHDIVYFNYTSNDIGFAVMGCLAQKYNRKLICDFDDALHEILSDNPAYVVFKKGAWGREVVTAIINNVSHITCTNSHLKHSLVFNSKRTNDDITVLPNFIDLNLYNYRCKFKDRGYYVGLYFGSSTHFADLYTPEFVGAMDRIMKEYPNFTFKSIGVFIPSFRQRWGMRYEQGFGHTDLLKWIKLMPNHMDGADFMIVPLKNSSYVKSKSSIKFLEASSYKIPGIWQNIRQYQEVIKHGENGLLASTADEWYNGIARYLNDAKFRKSAGENAFKTIQDWTIQKNIKLYADFFKKILI